MLFAVAQTPLLEFGRSLAFVDTTALVVGAPGSDLNQGAAFVYQLSVPSDPSSAWTHVATLTPSFTSGPGPRFGQAVAVEPSSTGRLPRLLVGSPHDAARGQLDAGAVHLYVTPAARLVAWREMALLT